MYLCGNSLGLQPKEASKLVLEELQVWAARGVEAHFDHQHERPWAKIETTVAPKLAKVLGAKPDEVAVMGSTTTNLHLLMAAFYLPSTAGRHKILFEQTAFPSDQYVFQSQVKWHGLDPKTSLVPLHSTEDYALQTEYILNTIDQHAKDTALLVLGGVQYYTGQYFDIANITKHAKSKGIVVGWDLAHAAGNVDLRLHDWNVDFAVWCAYKYLNGGPGGIAGLFVHERATPRITLSGWWGQEYETRFKMLPGTFPRR